MSDLIVGLRPNLRIFAAQLVQVFFVGLMIGMQRTIVPPLAKTEFGVASGSVALISAFVVSFGVVKGAMNFFSGHLAERYGRQPILFFGWIFAIPIPFLFYFAPTWGWIVAANILLGINQGFAWSMTVTAKMDIVKGGERGMATGFNEFAGYSGVAIAGIIAGYLASYTGVREAMLIFGLPVVAFGLVHAWRWFPETLPFRTVQSGAAQTDDKAVFASTEDEKSVFSLVTYRDKTLSALTQAGHVEKFVDALIWLALPLHLIAAGRSLIEIGWVAGTYGLVWGGSQLLTGPLSDLIGRRNPSIAGMWICAGGILWLGLATSMSMLLSAAAVTGFGMALLYPTLIAAISDRSHPAWRGKALGAYRFWRDTGYALGAIVIGLAIDLTGTTLTAFILTALAMFASGMVLFLRMEETHQRPSR